MGLFTKDKGDQICPLLNGPCVKEKCKFWVKLIGEDPQTRKAYDQWDCAISWLPIMLVENSQMTRQGTATVQEFRSEVHGAAKMIAEESVRRRELEETRLQVDQRLLDLKTQGLIESGKKDEDKEDV